MYYSLVLFSTFFLFFFFSIASSKIIIQNGLNETLNVQLGKEASILLLPGDYHSFQPPPEQIEKEYYEGKAIRPDDSYLIFGAKHGEHLIIGKEDIKADEEIRKIWWFSDAEHERDSINSIDEWLSNGGHHHQMGLEKSEFDDLIDYIHTKSI